MICLPWLSDSSIVWFCILQMVSRILDVILSLGCNLYHHVIITSASPCGNMCLIFIYTFFLPWSLFFVRSITDIYWGHEMVTFRLNQSDQDFSLPFFSSVCYLIVWWYFVEFYIKFLFIFLVQFLLWSLYYVLFVFFSVWKLYYLLLYSTVQPFSSFVCAPDMGTNWSKKSTHLVNFLLQ